MPRKDPVAQQLYKLEYSEKNSEGISLYNSNYYLTKTKPKREASRLAREATIVHQPSQTSIEPTVHQPPQRVVRRRIVAPSQPVQDFQEQPVVLPRPYRTQALSAFEELDEWQDSTITGLLGFDQPFTLDFSQLEQGVLK